MSRYRNSEELYRNRTLRGYRDMGSDRYLASRAYPKLYRNPKPARTYSRPTGGRGGRGRSGRNSKPEYFQSPKPEKKYESVVNSEKLSSPFVEKSLRYMLENNSGRTEIDTEQVAKEVQRRIEGKLTEQFFEKFRDELEELLRKSESTLENSAKTTELKTESPQKVERVESHHEERKDLETDRVENDGGTPELDESKKNDDSLEGDFVFSQPFGLAIPIETNEAELERVMQKSESEKKTVDESETEAKESESAEKLGEEDIEEEPEGIETETEDEPTEAEESETTETVDLELEDIEAEESPIPEESSGNVPEEIIESEETTLEPLPEEAELYPVEEEPCDAEVV